MIEKEYYILIVEDEFISLEYLKDILLNIGFEKIFYAKNAEDAIDITVKNKIDLIFMDININGSIDGITCAKIINKKAEIPIIYTTAYADSFTIKDANSTNIYGYIVKPFNIQELEATLNVAMKFLKKEKEKDINKNNFENEILLAENYKYFKKTKTLKYNGNVVNLTKKELEILNLLSLHINQNISYDSLIDLVWEGKIVTASTIRDTISRLKKKVPELNIQNISNYGYVLNVYNR